MPACRDCKHFDAAAAACRLVDGRPKSRTRACVRAIILRYRPQFRGVALEVGPGVAKLLTREFLRSRKVDSCYGVDPRYDGKSERRVRGQVGSLPFGDCSFDWVGSIATVEHWREYGDSIESGLSEIVRVLKPGGRMLLHAPFGVHGDWRFLCGDDGSFCRLVDAAGFSEVRYEEWRRDHDPLPSLPAWDSRFVPDRLRAWLRRRRPGLSAWHLEVLGIK